MRDNLLKIKAGVSGQEISIDEVSRATAGVDRAIKGVVDIVKATEEYEELVYVKALNILRLQGIHDFLIIPTSQIEKDFDTKLKILFGTDRTDRVERVDREELLYMIEKYLKLEKVKERLKQHIQGLA